jgi:hypothetical protein
MRASEAVRCSEYTQGAVEHVPTPEAEFPAPASIAVNPADNAIAVHTVLEPCLPLSPVARESMIHCCFRRIFIRHREKRVRSHVFDSTGC